MIPKNHVLHKLWLQSTEVQGKAFLTMQTVGSSREHALPGWWRIPSPTAQWSQRGAIQVAEGNLLARVQLGTGNWTNRN